MKKSYCGLIVISLFFIVFLPITVFGHSYVTESTPEDGAEVDVVEEITLTFNAGIENVSTATVIGEDGEIPGTIEVESPVITIYFDEALPPGQYEVQWQALGEDTHTTEGDFSFVVAAVEEEEQEEEQELEAEIVEDEADPVSEEIIEEDEASQGSEELLQEEDVEEEDGENYAWIIIGVAVLAAIGGFLVVMKRRR